MTFAIFSSYDQGEGESDILHQRVTFLDHPLGSSDELTKVSKVLFFFNVHMLQDSAFGIHRSRIGQKWSKGAFKDPEMSLCGCKCTLLADQRQE